MSKTKFPATPATRQLNAAGISYGLHSYQYEEKGGTRQTSDELGVDEHAVIKTIVLIDDGGEIVIMLQHGDTEVSTKKLARVLGVKTLSPCSPKEANKATGYVFGGTSPFGTRKALTIAAEQSIFDLDRIFINAGKQGLIAELNPQDILKIIKVIKVEAKA